MTSASNGSERTIPLPNRVDANCSVVLRNFGRCNSIGPAMVLTVTPP
jgi:hypothetical protein